LKREAASRHSDRVDDHRVEAERVAWAKGARPARDSIRQGNRPETGGGGEGEGTVDSGERAKRKGRISS